MAIRIDGRELSKKVKERIKAEVEELVKSGKRAPGLAVIQIGEDPASSIYVRNKERACEQCGFVSWKKTLAEDTSQEELLALVEEFNNNPDCDGILCQLPLPEGLDENLVIETIRPDKDVDGFHPINAGKLLLGLPTLEPCTPYGIMEMLHEYGIDVAGKNAVVLGRSNIVGKPIALMLLREHATVTICHSRTKNLEQICREADILVTAMGRADMVDLKYTNPDQIIIDVSINRKDDGKVVGDVLYSEVEPKVQAITPVPGGVGPMTIAMLMQNTLNAYKRHEGISEE
ncbi:MAG: bifunctional methylenetetrahydrofolate dehydrogenase/methenyltetrahydrofolate cyclohydrolase FolD [Eubacteriales bacterium]|nr:bifunctional methylenetetrahydrofolate dehydrogenase/methenyltetrahydrofolate cyclohydrolase FolD [Eubacteriales bacterium]